MSRLTCLALVVMILAWTPAVLAQNTQRVSEGQRAAGEALLASGQAAFRAGNYAEALRSYEQALARLGRPAIYEDIGEAAGRLGDHQRALAAYREYLGAMSNAPDRDDIERRIQFHQRALAEASGGAKTAAPVPGDKPADVSPTAAASTQALETPAPEDAPVAPASEPAKERAGGELWWLWAGIGAVVVGGVVAALIVTSSDDPVQPPMRGNVGGTIQTLEVR